MTHSDLITRAERWLLNTKNCGFVLTELTSLAAEVPDAIGWQHNHSLLVECKVTRCDFLADAKKRFRRDPLQGMGNYRYYLSPPEVIKEADLPENWGLLWAWPRRVCIVRKAKCFADPQIAVNERYLLYSALRRVWIRGDLKKIYSFETIDLK